MTTKKFLLTCVLTLFCINLSYARWFTTDPKAQKYYATSPYAYCLNNPIKFIDPNGMEIHESGKKEWARNKSIIQRNLGRMQQRWDKLAGNGANDSRITNLGERISSIHSTLGTMENLESSSQVYALGGLDENGLGGLRYNNSTGIITIGYNGTANFIHEVTHGGQFETGDIAFALENNRTYGQDIFDEVAAYRAQYAYDPSSVSRLPSPGSVRTITDINPAWVQGIVYNGENIYTPTGSARTGLYPVNINSTKADLMRAYPNATLPRVSNTIPFKNIYPMHYKQ